MLLEYALQASSSSRALLASALRRTAEERQNEVRRFGGLYDVSESIWHVDCYTKDARKNTLYKLYESWLLAGILV